MMTKSSPTDTIKDRWELISVLGKGAFGTVYKAKDLLTGESVAVKIESAQTKKPVLKIETQILKKLNNSALPCQHHYFCGLRAGGSTVNTPSKEPITYLVMTLAESNLSDLRKQQPEGKFTISTTALLGTQMIEAIQQLHSIGYLHRDVKPANFCLASDIRINEYRPRILLIDFGLSRRFLTPNNTMRPARANVGFRGTARYASICAHFGQDQSRKDDLWAVFYITVEFLTGTLPWKGREKNVIGELKTAFTNLNLVKGLPIQMSYIYDYLSQLNYESVPDYAYLASLFDEMFDQSQSPIDVQYCWEKKLSVEKPTLKYNDVSQTIVNSGSHEMAIRTPTYRDTDQTLQNEAKIEPRPKFLTRPPQKPLPCTIRNFRARKYKNYRE